MGFHVLICFSFFFVVIFYHLWTWYRIKSHCPWNHKLYKASSFYFCTPSRQLEYLLTVIIWDDTWYWDIQWQAVWAVSSPGAGKKTNSTGGWFKTKPYIWILLRSCNRKVILHAQEQDEKKSLLSCHKTEEVYNQHRNKNNNLHKKLHLTINSCIMDNFFYLLFYLSPYHQCYKRYCRCQNGDLHSSIDPTTTRPKIQRASEV